MRIADIPTGGEFPATEQFEVYGVDTRDEINAIILSKRPEKPDQPYTDVLIVRDSNPQGEV